MHLRFGPQLVERYVYQFFILRQYFYNSGERKTMGKQEEKKTDYEKKVAVITGFNKDSQV